MMMGRWGVLVPGAGHIVSAVRKQTLMDIGAQLAFSSLRIPGPTPRDRPTLLKTGLLTSVNLIKYSLTDKDKI